MTEPKKLIVVLNVGDVTHQTSVKPDQQVAEIIGNIKAIKTDRKRKNYLAIELQENDIIYNSINQNSVLLSLVPTRSTNQPESEAPSAEIRTRISRNRSNSTIATIHQQTNILFGQFLAEMQNAVGQAKINLTEVTQEAKGQIVEALKKANIGVQQNLQHNVNNAPGGSANVMGSIVNNPPGGSATVMDSIINKFEQALNEGTVAPRSESDAAPNSSINAFLKQLALEIDTEKTEEDKSQLYAFVVKLFRVLFDNETLGTIVQLLKKVPQFSSVVLENQLQTVDAMLKIEKMEKDLATLVTKNEQIERLLRQLVNSVAGPNAGKIPGLHNNNNVQAGAKKAELSDSEMQGPYEFSDPMKNEDKSEENDSDVPMPDSQEV